MRALVSSLALAAVIALPLTAHADAPPPDGQKYVGFQFKVQGLSADQLLVAYPWSLSGGAPTREHTVVRGEAPVSVGRRSPTVQLYAVDKAAWERFEAEALKKVEYQSPEYHAALDGFLKAPNAAPCNVQPNDQHMLPTSDPRETIEEVLVAKTVSPSSCVLEAVPLPKPKTGCTGGGLELWFGLGALGLLAARRKR
jgi:hypothetical protein